MYTVLENILEASMKLKKREIIIIVCLLAAAAAAWAVMYRNRTSVDHGKIRITVDGDLYGEYDLGTDQRIPINETNTCRIMNGKAQMIEATCPDHLCISQPPIDEKGGFIICLPNHVIIEGIPVDNASGSGEAGGLDGIAS